jgi:MFS family permease
MRSRGLTEFRRSWLLVAVSMVGMCFGGSGVLWYSFGVLITPLRQAFGWSNTDVGAWATFVSIGSLVGLPTAGRLADRYGVRRVVLSCIPLCALAIGLGSLITAHRWTLYLVAFAVGTLAAGISSLTYSRAINGWFSAARGTALGLMSAGIGLGATFGPRLVQSIVDRFGLQFGFYALAAMVLVPFPLMVLFLHEWRERAGEATLKVEGGLTRREAMRQPVFWLLGIGSIVWTLCAGANFHLVPFLTNSGLGRAEAANVVGWLGVSAMVGRMVTGFVIDRFHAPYVCAGVFLVEAVAYASLGFIPVRSAQFSIMVIGLSHGAEVDCFTYCTARYFGIKSYGVVFGLLSVGAAIGNGIGPPLFGFVRDLTGSYREPFLMDALFGVGAAILLMFAGRHPFIAAASEKKAE